MRIVSLNAWGGREWDALSNWLPTVDADVLCLQEVTRSPVPSPDWLIYRDPYRELAQRGCLFRDVSAHLPDHQAIFAPAARGHLETEAGQIVLSEHGLALWVRRDLAVAEMRHTFIHGDFRVNGWGPEPVPRTAQAIRVVNTDTGESACVVHLHGLRDPVGKGDSPERAKQTQAVIALLRTIRRDGEFATVLGDFNVQPDSAMLSDLEAEGLVDLVTTRGHSDTRTSLYTKPMRYADYAMVSDPSLVRDFDVPAEPEVSDHRPLILDLAI